MLSDINLTEIQSTFISQFEDPSDTPIPISFTPILDDFNNRHITPSNLNQILSFCDYLMIENTDKFVFKNLSLQLPDLYVLSEEHKEHYTLPAFTHEKDYESVVLYENRNYFDDYMMDIDDPTIFTLYHYALIYNNTPWALFVVLHHRDELTYTQLFEAIASDNIDCFIFIYAYLRLTKRDEEDEDDDEEKELITKILYACIEFSFTCFMYVIKGMEMTLPLFKLILAVALKVENVDVIDYLDKGTDYQTIGEIIVERISESPSLPLLLYCIKHKYHVPSNTLDDHVIMLQPSHINELYAYNCKFTAIACAHVAYNGDLSLLTALHNNHCPWNELTPLSALLRGRFECMKYAITSGCPMPNMNDFKMIADISPCEECKKYINEL